MKIHLDFETRSELNIKKVGAWVYSMHPSTEVLCMATAVDENEIKVVPREKLGWHSQLLLRIDKDVLYVAHNAMFEYMIWHNILVKRFGYPEIPKEQWRCTAAKASALALPRGLEACATALQLKQTKDKEGYAIMLKMCKPRKPTKADKELYEGKDMPVLWHESPEDFVKLHKYCKGDVQVQRDLDNKLRDLSPREQEIFHLNQEVNLRGIKIDTQAVDAALKMIELYTKQEEQKVIKLSDGFLDGLSKRQRVLTWIKGEGVNLSDFTKETVNEALNREIPSKIREVLKIRQELGKTSVAKFKAFKESTDADGEMKDTQIYHGAATGRETGQRAQLHNLHRVELANIDKAIELLKIGDLELLKTFSPNILNTLSQCIRGMLVAREGHEFIGADWNAIEVRLLFWFAGEKFGLEQYRSDDDLYVDIASIIFGTYHSDVTKMQRFVGKQTVLGCGYGMGLNGERFVATCRKHNVTVPIALAKRAVRSYRNTYPVVPAYWKIIERAVVDAIRTKKVVKVGVLNIFTHEDFLFIQLPSKRMLAYHQPKLEGTVVTHMGWVSQRGCYERQRTWGGVFVENIVQGTARDVVEHGKREGEKLGYKTLLTVHDEILTEVPTNTRTVQLYETLLTQNRPEWIGDCPLKVEGWKGQRFLKQ